MIAKKIEQICGRIGVVALVVAVTLSLAATSVGAGILVMDQAQQSEPPPDPKPVEDVTADETTPGQEVLAGEFLATAYCLQGTTSSGVRVNRGVIAADPKVLPLGSIVRLHAGEHSGIYTVLDTGEKIKGRRLDLWFPSYQEAIEFGVRKVRVELIRYGWDPAGAEVGSP